MFTVVAIMTMETIMVHGGHVDHDAAWPPTMVAASWFCTTGGGASPEHIFCPSVSLKTEERQIQAAKLTMTVMVKMITISDHDKVRFPNPLAD